jgi:site-specific DNA recombinase
MAAKGRALRCVQRAQRTGRQRKDEPVPPLQLDYRYYTCSTKARQGPMACTGMTVPMEKLDALVATHLEKRLLDPKRLEQILSTVLDRRQERSERKRQHIAELNKRATETDLRLNRL